MSLGLCSWRAVHSGNRGVGEAGFACPTSHSLVRSTSLPFSHASHLSALWCLSHGRRSPRNTGLQLPAMLPRRLMAYTNVSGGRPGWPADVTILMCCSYTQSTSAMQPRVSETLCATRSRLALLNALSVNPLRRVRFYSTAIDRRQAASRGERYCAKDVRTSLMTAQGRETPLEVQCCDSGFDENLSLLKVKVRSCVVGVVEAQWEEVREKEQERAQIYCSRWCGGVVVKANRRKKTR